MSSANNMLCRRYKLAWKSTTQSVYWFTVWILCNWEVTVGSHWSAGLISTIAPYQPVLSLHITPITTNIKYILICTCSYAVVCVCVSAKKWIYNPGFEQFYSVNCYNFHFIFSNCLLPHSRHLLHPSYPRRGISMNCLSLPFSLIYYFFWVSFFVLENFREL